jgi:hypothetical protein
LAGGLFPGPNRHVRSQNGQGFAGLALVEPVACPIATDWPGRVARFPVCLRPDNTPPYAWRLTLVSTALWANYRGGRWFESIAAPDRRK